MKTDREYIKTAIELAGDEWEYQDCNAIAWHDWEAGDIGGRISDGLQILLDALAAQLYRKCIDGGHPVAWMCFGLDTIKDILDRGVLEQ